MPSDKDYYRADNDYYRATSTRLIRCAIFDVGAWIGVLFTISQAAVVWPEYRAAFGVLGIGLGVLMSLKLRLSHALDKRNLHTF